MSWLDTFRYGIALLTVMSVPWAMLFWYLVHPFIGFWRKRGPAVTYTVMILLGVTLAALAWIWRDVLMATEYGTGPFLWAPAAVLYGAAFVVALYHRRHLKFRILVGMPELSPQPGGGKLLNEGIYSRVRHPRYVSLTFGMLGAALFCNYLSMWVLTLLLVPALYGIVLFEERELRDRFGQAYVEYSKRVPRFVPRFGNTSPAP